MTTPTNQSPFLRVQRNFPQDSSQALSVELSKAYLDIAQNVNKRVIGGYSNVSTVTGESWVLTGSASKQQTERQVYPITGAGAYPHGIAFNKIVALTRIYGTFSNGTNQYPLPYVDAAAATNQVEVYVDPTNINVVAGGGAPTVTSGYVILEWLSYV